MDFRDDTQAYLGSRGLRRKILREIRAVEREELGLPPIDETEERLKQARQQARVADLYNRGRKTPNQQFSGFLRGPKSKRTKSSTEGSNTTLFTPDPSDGDNSFWCYASYNVTQLNLRNLLRQAPDASELPQQELERSSVCGNIRRKIDEQMTRCAHKARFGVLFDIISTSNIIRSGYPHAVGQYIYQYVQSKHSDKHGLKFIFVGITDNINCCTARDVFCRDEYLDGVYVGDTKRSFDALDNVHMFAVFPSQPGGIGAPLPSLFAGGGSKSLSAGTFGGKSVGRKVDLLSASPLTAPAASPGLVSIVTNEVDEEHKLTKEQKKALFDRRDWTFLTDLAPSRPMSSAGKSVDY